jgi:peptidoglycan hydrolase-like protein with peptidoglycan-binding domain
MRRPTAIRRSRTGRLAAIAAGLFVAVVALGAFPTNAMAEDPARAADAELIATAVGALSEVGILRGRDTSSFVPEDSVTRAQMAVYLARALGLTDAEAPAFSDVAPEDWYALPVGAAYEAGLVTGTTPGAFSPDQPVTREEAAAWIVSALGYRVMKDPDYVIPFRLPQVEQGAWLAGFRDRALISAGSAWGVANAHRLGIVDAATDGWFYPTLPLSRAEAAVMLYRAFVQPIAVRDAYPGAVSVEESYPSLSSEDEGPLVLYLESRLAELHYCPGPIDGVFDYRTGDAVLAFAKAEGLTRDKVAGPQVWGHIFTAQTPAPHLTKDGYRVEIDLTRQILLMIDDNEVWKIVHVSTGRKGTRTGSFSIGVKQEGWVECVTLEGKMYYPSYVVSRTAIHGYESVPAWPASHGCVRVPVWMAVELYYQLPKDTPVDIYYS